MANEKIVTTNTPVKLQPIIRSNMARNNFEELLQSEMPNMPNRVLDYKAEGAMNMKSKMN